MTHKRTLEDWKLEHWKKTGLAVKYINREAKGLYCDIYNRFGATNRDTKKMDRVCKLLDEIRCDLEGKMFNEHPNLGEEWDTLFFGDSIFDKENNND